MHGMKWCPVITTACLCTPPYIVFMQTQPLFFFFYTYHVRLFVKIVAPYFLAYAINTAQKFEFKMTTPCITYSMHFLVCVRNMTWEMSEYLGTGGFINMMFFKTECKQGKSQNARLANMYSNHKAFKTGEWPGCGKLVLGCSVLQLVWHLAGERCFLLYHKVDVYVETSVTRLLTNVMSFWEKI